jgi:hypothetical protein
MIWKIYIDTNAIICYDPPVKKCVWISALSLAPVLALAAIYVVPKRFL